MVTDTKTHGILLMVLLAGIAAGIAGCSNRLAPTGSKGVIMPLAVGNRWIGRTRLSTGAYVFDTLRITRDTIVRNARWYITSNGVMLANRSDGLYTWDIASARRGVGKPKRALKFPVLVGDALNDMGNLTRVFEDGRNDEMLREVLTVMSTDTVIEVAAGSYHCIKAVLQRYRLDGSPDTVKFMNDDPLYFAPGIGLVQTGGYRPNLGSIGLSHPWQLYSVSLR